MDTSYNVSNILNLIITQKNNKNHQITVKKDKEEKKFTFYNPFIIFDNKDKFYILIGNQTEFKGNVDPNLSMIINDISSIYNSNILTSKEKIKNFVSSNNKFFIKNLLTNLFKYYCMFNLIDMKYQEVKPTTASNNPTESTV